MANSENTFVVVLELSKISTFLDQVKAKNYHFQDCRINPSFNDAIKDVDFPDFYRTKSDSKSVFCVVRINQNKFFELEKIISSLDGAIESIEWPKINEIITFEPTAAVGGEGIDEAINISDKNPAPVKVDNLWVVLFSIILNSLILHDIWVGLILVVLGIVKTHKDNQDNQRCLFAGVLTVLIGIVCNSFIGNLIGTQPGSKISQYFDWISNLQLLDIFSRNETLPVNQLLVHYKIAIPNFYIFVIVGIGAMFQVVKYIDEIISNAKLSKINLSILRFFWLSSILVLGLTSFLYFALNLTNNLFWIPGIVLLLLTLFYQTESKISGFLLGNFGLSEYVKSILKILPFGVAAFLGLIYYQLTKELNGVFNDYFLRGWDFSKVLIAVLVAQSLLSLIFIWISFWSVKIILKIAK